MWNAFRTRLSPRAYACLRLSFSMSGVSRLDRDRFTSARPVSVCASERKVSAARWPDDTSAIIWPLLAAVPNSCGSNGIDGDRLEFERLGEVRRLDLGPLRHADLVEAVLRAAVVRARGAQQVDQVLGVAQVGEIGRGDDQDVVGADQRAPAPSRSTHAARRARCTARVERSTSKIESKASAPKS